MNELTDAVKKTLIERINTPLFGFISISWVMFNWDNILFVMFSKLTIEQRINGLRAAELFYFKSFVLPVAVGFILSVIFPYLQILISILQRTAQSINDNINLSRERAACAAIISLAREKAQADGAVKRATAEENKELAIAEDEISKIRFGTHELEVNFNELNENITNGKSELAELQAQIQQGELEIKLQESKIENMQKGHVKYEGLIEALKQYKKEADILGETISSLKDNLIDDGVLINDRMLNGKRKVVLSPFKIIAPIDKDNSMDNLGKSLNTMNSSISRMQSAIKDISLESDFLVF
ncbi:hypothetical protein I5N29_02055 [Serratia marcescens]|nr:hypothetical protein [Serratia marcescens]